MVEPPTEVKQEGDFFGLRIDNTKKEEPQTVKQEEEPARESTNFEKEIQCQICSGNHLVAHCETFQQKGVNDRWSDVKLYGLCRKCLTKHN